MHIKGLRKVFVLGYRREMMLGRSSPSGILLGIVAVGLSYLFSVQIVGNLVQPAELGTWIFAILNGLLCIVLFGRNKWLVDQARKSLKELSGHDT